MFQLRFVMMLALLALCFYCGAKPHVTSRHLQNMTGAAAGVSGDLRCTLTVLRVLPLLPGVRDNSIKTYNKLTNKALIQTPPRTHQLQNLPPVKFSIEDSLENLMKKLFQFPN